MSLGLLCAAARPHIYIHLLSDWFSTAVIGLNFCTIIVIDSRVWVCPCLESSAGSFVQGFSSRGLEVFNHQLFFRMYREIIRVFENSPIICGKNPFYANLFVPRAYLIIDGVFSNRSI